MNKQDVLKLAAQCGIVCWTRNRWVKDRFVPIDDGMDGDMACLMQFAELIARQERKACAELCEDAVQGLDTDYKELGFELADRLRLRADMTKGERERLRSR